MPRQSLLLAVFVLSGFAGLIYQSVWSHYIGLFLGHAAYAQALVLAMFMGGMAIGAAWIAKAGERWRNLIRTYALIELAIGLLGLLFHAIFTGVMGFSYDVLIPATESAAGITVLKWLIAAVLILPQTILLGMTFPLMSGGLIRRYPGHDGSLLGGLYFTNSIGAAVGALVSAFLLVPWVGLPGATTTAGIINVLVAILAWVLAREPEPLPTVSVADAGTGGESSTSSSRSGLLRVVLWGTALSGAASFIYEIVWIRMLSMAVGSTLQAFELMLASFIAGIALGGLWIRKRADRTSDPLRLVGWMQILMGLAALLSLVFYANAFEWVGWLMRALSRSDAGYALFNLGTAGIAILIMMPAAFFAGTTLPLFTVALLRAGFGERSIGRVYAWNTMGSILGVFLAIHLLIPALGLKLALCAGALLDMAIGLGLLRMQATDRKVMLRFAVAGLVCALGLGLAIVHAPFDPMRLASGVFRHGLTQLNPADKILFYRDGKTASVSVVGSSNGGMRIATNGKVDASLTTAEGVGPQYDEPTMAIVAAVPLSLHPKPERIGVIGFGSGMSTHTLLGDPRVGRVDTVEIEAAMVQGARAFGRRVQRAYDDPRSHIVIDDAKAYFASQKGGYDIIISEPSNPWISGIGALFSKEFYTFIPRQLKDDGLFVQWLQLYEIDNRLVASVLNGLTPAFNDYSAWLANQTDLVIVATRADRLPDVDYERVLKNAIGADLKYLGITRPEQMALRKVADARIMRAIGRLYDVPPNSDFHPLLSIEAPRTRYTDQKATTVMMLPTLGHPLLEMLGLNAAVTGDLEPEVSNLYPGEWYAVRARQALDFLAKPGATEALPAEKRASLAQLLSLGDECAASGQGLQDFLTRLSEVAASTVPFVPADAMAPLLARESWQQCRSRNPAVDRALAIVEATSRREATAMREAGEAWFQLPREGESPDLRPFDERALFAILLAEASVEDWAALRSMNDRYGAKLALSWEGTQLSALLLSLADDEPPKP